MIRSKFSLLVYLTIPALSAFIVLGVYLLINPEIQVHTRFAEFNGVTLPGLILVGVFGYLLLIFLRKVFVLKIDKDRLDLLTLDARHTLQRSDIQFIDLRGRETIYGQGADVVTIATVYGKTHTLPERLCGNMPEIKQMLTLWYGELIINRPTADSRPHLTYTSETEVFRGNPLLSIHGLVFWVTLLAFLWECLSFVRYSLWQTPLTLIPIGLLGGFAALAGSELCYFILSPGQLEIKNHVFPWYRKTHELDDISDVVFAFASKRAYSLRIHTIDQRSHNYRAGSLRSASWKALEKAFRKRRVMVYNELPGL